MSPAGYSGTPLWKKLGISDQSKLLLLNAPPNYAGLIETDLEGLLCGKDEVPGIVHLFAENNAAFEASMKKLVPLINKNKNITIWVSWYKKSAKMDTDLSEDVIRNYALKNELVDVKVCAVSDLWSGLKLVVPKALRK